MKVKAGIRKKSTADTANCAVCGGGLEYAVLTEARRCAVCGGEYPSNVQCVKGHYVCDACHSSGAADILGVLSGSGEGDPLRLIRQLMERPSVHLHGPEHHFLVPCVLLTAYKNSGGELDLEESLGEAVRRGRQVPGGVCGYWGACGAAIGAGIFASIAAGSTPLKKEVWSLPNRLTARCLEKMAAVGGPRCCKRTSYMAIETAVEYAGEVFGVRMPVGGIACRHSDMNKECIKSDCPYFAPDMERNEARCCRHELT